MPDARDMLEQGVTADPGNDSGASFPDYDAAFAATDATGEQALRRAAFDRMEAINAREVFYAPIFFTNDVFLVHPSVRNWIDSILGGVQDWRGIHLSQ
jgi:ABC-type oligopeptide transport system substrate-binding subunit